MNLEALLPTLTLKERPVREYLQENGLDIVVEDVPVSTMIYLKKCTSGNLTIRSKITKVVLEGCDDIVLTMEGPLITGNLEIISCKNVTAFLTRLVPVINIEKSSASTFHLFREDPATEEFRLLSTSSSTLSIIENQANYQVPADVQSQQFMTRFIEGRWLTERIIYENGYQTTEREKEINLARAERDELKLAASMRNSITVSPASSFGSGISRFSKKNLKPTTTKVRTISDMLGAPQPKPQKGANELSEDLKEYFDEPEILRAKVRELAELIRKSKHAVAFTGAGISCSTGLPTYRGPNGVWTRRDQGLAPLPSIAIDAARPAPAHMALVKLMQEGLLKHVVSTNVDGLHRRSGISEEDLSELHGNCYKENCKTCGKEYLRRYDATSGGCRADHLTGATCECGGPLVDNIVNFGENLPEKEIDKAVGHAEKGDLALILGTSMKVSPACNIPDKIWKKKSGAMVIVNLQKTPFDRYAALRIFGETDKVLDLLMKELSLQIPDFIEN